MANENEAVGCTAATTTITTATSATATQPKDATRRRFLPKWWRRPTQHTMIQWVVVLPYVVGVVWHLYGHVRYSVLTGDFHNPKRSYIDENSLDPNHFQLYGTYRDMTATKAKPVVTASLCESRLTQETMTGIRLACFQYHARNDHDYRNQATTTRRKSKPPSPSTVTNHGSFEILKIVPHAAGIVPSQEAIVLVVPSFGIKKKESLSLLHQQQYQMSLIQFIQRLSSPTISPWLSKIVLIVAPLDAAANSTTTNASMNPTLEATVQSFLRVYLGTARQENESPSSILGLPPEFLGSIIRHVLVMDWETFTPSSSSSSSTATPEAQQRHVDDRNEIRILSSGRRGVLPNLDLTFLFKFIYERSNMVQQLQQIYDTSSHKYTMTDVVVHPYEKRIVQHMASIRHRIKQIEQTCTSMLPKTVVSSVSSLVSTIVSGYETLLPLVAYESLLMIGPYPPHTPALDHGIDSITLQAYFAATANVSTSTTNNNRNVILPQQYMTEYIQRMELVMRSLSNLHERLHHSTSLYLLVSKDRFVKHEEYLIPNILLILPLLIRAILYIISSDDENNDNDIDNRTNESDTNTNITVEGRKRRHHFSLAGIVGALFIIFVVSSIAIELILHYSFIAIELIRRLEPIPYKLYIVPVLIVAILFMIVSYTKNQDDEDNNNNSDNNDNRGDESGTKTDDKKVAHSVPEYLNVEVHKRRHQFSFTAIGQALLITFVWSTLAMDFILYLSPLFAFDNPYSPAKSILERIGYCSSRYPMELVYVIVILKLAESSQKISKGSPSLLMCTIDRKHQRCVQFMSCLLAAYIHFGIAFGHVSLAFPSALIWTPLLAFPTYHSRHANFVKWVGNTLIFFFSLFITSPFVFLVPNVFPTYTPYVRYVYIPLHMLFCIQHIIPSFNKD